MGDDEHHREESRKRPTNVVRLPRDWLGPREDLVPLRVPGPPEPDGREAAVLEFPGAPSPSHDDFWGGAPDAIPDPVVAPAGEAPDPPEVGAYPLAPPASDRLSSDVEPPPGVDVGPRTEHRDARATRSAGPTLDRHRGASWTRVGVMAVLAALVVMFARHVGDRQGPHVAAQAGTTTAPRGAITFPPSLSTIGEPPVLSAHVSPHGGHGTTAMHRRTASNRRRKAAVRHAARGHAAKVTTSVVTAVAARAPASRTPASTSSAAHATSVSSTGSTASTYSGPGVSSQRPTTTYHPVGSTATTHSTTSTSHKAGPIGAGAAFGPGVQVG
jgi:hypothetical protein